MGTRHLIYAIVDGERKLANYGQWDGYIDGQGETILKFLSNEDVEYDNEHFRAQLRKCRFASEEEIDEVNKRFSDGNGWMTSEQARAFKDSEFGHWSRDLGAYILFHIYNSKGDEIILTDAGEFDSESWCEFAYVLDTDSEILDVYCRYNRENAEKKMFEGFMVSFPFSLARYPRLLHNEFNAKRLVLNGKTIENETPPEYSVEPYVRIEITSHVTESEDYGNTDEGTIGRFLRWRASLPDQPGKFGADETLEPGYYLGYYPASMEAEIREFLEGLGAKQES